MLVISPDYWSTAYTQPKTTYLPDFNKPTPQFTRTIGQSSLPQVDLSPTGTYNTTKHFLNPANFNSESEFYKKLSNSSLQRDDFLNVEYATQKEVGLENDFVPTSYKRYSCAQCKKGFKELGRYQDHLLSHKKIKSHPCPVCHKLFTFKSDIPRHIKNGSCSSKDNQYFTHPP